MKLKPCADCGAMIDTSGRHGRKLRCGPCSADKMRAVRKVHDDAVKHQRAFERTQKRLARQAEGLGQ
jgi:DNA-directed RNA polymerase subunit M/transcription elongation factor TFIIS